MSIPRSRRRPRASFTKLSPRAPARTPTSVIPYQWGKTGTTEDNTNAWFCGATDQITACVWVGYADSYQQMTTEYGGSPVDGGTYPALIWGRVVEAWNALEASRAADAKPKRQPRRPAKTSRPIQHRLRRSNHRGLRRPDDYSTDHPHHSGAGTDGARADGTCPMPPHLLRRRLRRHPAPVAGIRAEHRRRLAGLKGVEALVRERHLDRQALA